MKILEDPEVFNKIRTINNWWEMRKQSFELQLDIYKYVVNVEYAVASHYYKKLFCENSDVRGFLWSS